MSVGEWPVARWANVRQGSVWGVLSPGDATAQVGSPDSEAVWSSAAQQPRFLGDLQVRCPPLCRSAPCRLDRKAARRSAANRAPWFAVTLKATTPRPTVVM